MTAKEAVFSIYPDADVQKYSGRMPWYICRAGILGSSKDSYRGVGDSEEEAYEVVLHKIQNRMLRKLES